MTKKVICILVCTIIIVILLIICAYIFYTKSSKKQNGVIKNSISEEKYLLASKYFDLDQRKNTCHTYTLSNSIGLLFDEIIVCNILKELKATPYFYFEQFDDHSTMNDWIFVNLDCTLFDNFKNENSPNNILCKTKETYDILSYVMPNKKVIYTGFTSMDKFVPTIKKDYRKILHIAGKSPYKGTNYVVNAWIHNPSWPTLTIICNNKYRVVDGIKKILNNNNYENIKVLDNFIEENEIIKYMNEYGIHICTSEFEGFGHTSNEARSVEAVVLYTDSPLFQDRFIDNINGFSIGCKQNGFENKICPRYIPTYNGIVNTVNKVINMSEEELYIIGKKARQNFLEDDINFKNRLISVIRGTEIIPYIIHYVWISKEDPFENVQVPEKYNKYLQTWFENNKNFEFVYWSGKDILNLISSYFPQYLNFYMKLEPNICKCDFARFAIIAVYGGVYIDLDFYCRRNISYLLTGDSYFVYEVKEHFTKDKHLCNGFFASYAYNPFILGWMEQMTKNKNDSNVMTKTGPLGLYTYYKKNKNKVLFGNTCDILSITASKTTAEECKGICNNYAITSWDDGSGWQNENYNNHITFKNMKNPIDGTEMIWEESEFTRKNFPGLYFEVDEKKSIFEYAKNNKLNYGIIDVGAHIGDLSISLALALNNIGRNDVIVYAIDPSQEKCDFIEKMALINAVSNIKILNYGLSDFEKILGHDSTENINTGAQTWNIKKDKQIKFSSKTNEEESSNFIPVDNLFKKEEIERIGIYHIDVEGHEIEVLKGSKNLINICKPILFIENYINKNDKCKNENDCRLLFETIKDINPNYKHTGFLPNGDLIFEYIETNF